MEQINTFWNWFRDNNNEIFNLTTDSDYNITHHLCWLNEFLIDFCPKLYLILILPANKEMKAELIVSSEDPALYHCASVLVEHAPKVVKWKYITLQLPQALKATSATDTKFNTIKDVDLKSGDSENITAFHQPTYLIISFRSYTIICKAENVDDALLYLTHQLLKCNTNLELTFVEIERDATTQTDLTHFRELQFHIDHINHARNKSDL